MAGSSVELVRERTGSPTTSPDALDYGGRWRAPENECCKLELWLEPQQHGRRARAALHTYPLACYKRELTLTLPLACEAGPKTNLPNPDPLNRWVPILRCGQRRAHCLSENRRLEVVSYSQSPGGFQSTGSRTGSSRSSPPLDVANSLRHEVSQYVMRTSPDVRTWRSISMFGA